MRSTRILAALTAALLLTAAPAAPPAGQGDAAPKLELRDLDGKTWSLSALEGRVVHVAFVAVWCEPCRKEAKRLRDLSLRHRRAGYTLLVVGVPARQSPARLRDWAAQAGLEGVPVCYDEGGRATEALGADLLPHHVVIDRKGSIDRVDGRLSPRLVERLEALLAKKRRG